MTKIFHPNVRENGEICVNVLKRDWKPTMTLRQVLLTIRCLLIEPYPESALNEEAGKMLLEDYEAYSKHARLMTSIHAMTQSFPSPASENDGEDEVENNNVVNNVAAIDPTAAAKVASKAKASKEKKKSDKKRSLKRL